MKIHPHLRGIYEDASALGWTVTPTCNGHLCWRHPSGGLVYSASTPSDWRAGLNLRSELRRQLRNPRVRRAA